MRKDIVTVNARDVDDAMEELQTITDEALEALVYGGGTATCEYGIPHYFTYKGEEDCDWQQVGEFDFSLEDLGLDEGDLFDYIKELYDQHDECWKKVKEKQQEINKIKNELQNIVKKIEGAKKWKVKN